MRILGVIFILVGLVLCLTIVGAIFGGLLIIIGIVLVAVGGRRKTVITNVINVANTPTGAVPAEQAAASVSMLPRDAQKELLSSTSADRPAPTLVVPSSVQMAEMPQRSTAYDVAKWKALVEFDSDIADASKRVGAYGDRYVDQLAAAYLALNDKQYLGTVVDKIVERARRGE
jgi:uncharacterized protein DUF5362